MPLQAETAAVFSKDRDHFLAVHQVVPPEVVVRIKPGCQQRPTIHAESPPARCRALSVHVVPHEVLAIDGDRPAFRNAFPPSNRRMLHGGEVVALRLLHIIPAQDRHETMIVVVDRLASHLVLTLKVVLGGDQVTPPTRGLGGALERILRAVILRPAAVRTLE